MSTSIPPRRRPSKPVIPGAEAKPTALAVRPEAIPAALRKRRQWVVWRFVWDGKWWKKPPFNPVSDKPAKSNDAKTWGTFAQAVRRYRDGKYDGIGFMLSADDPFVAVDLDDCHDTTTGRTDDFAERVIALLRSYAEASPSGAGLHVIIRGELPRTIKAAVAEVYARGQYITMTGHRRPDCPATVNRRPAAFRTFLEWLDCKRELPPARPRAARPAAADGGAGSFRGLDDDDLIAFACREKKKFNLYWHGQLAGKPSWSEASFGLTAYLAFYTGCDADRMDRLMRQSKLYRDKWDEPRGDSTWGQREIAKAIRTSKVFGRDGSSKPASGRCDRPTAGHAPHNTQHTRVYTVSGGDPVSNDRPGSRLPSPAATPGRVPLAQLYAQAMAVEPPPEAERYSRPGDESIRRLVALCRRLSVHWAPNPFPLACRPVAGLLGLRFQRASELIGRLVADGTLAVAFMPKPGELGKSAEYVYISRAADDAGAVSRRDGGLRPDTAASCRPAARRHRGS
jgi:hypothetical protein